MAGWSFGYASCAYPYPGTAQGKTARTGHLPLCQFPATAGWARRYGSQLVRADHHRLRRQHPVLQCLCQQSIIHAGNVVAIVQAGRARWKVENENNNTLKTQGYHLTHNFGHGQQHLSALLVTLNLLAFLFHTVLDMMDAKYPLIRAKLPSRKMFFQHIQALTCYICFENFDALLNFMLRDLKIDVPDTG
jgi:hypothetical protein